MKKSLWIIVVLMLPRSNYAQKVAVYPTYFNVLYMGIDNPLKVVVENYNCDSISVSANMNMRKTTGCEYVVTPRSLNTGIITVSGVKNGENRALGKHQFRVLSVPDPMAIVGRKSGGDIRREELFSIYGMEARLDNFIYEVEFRIKSFTVVIERDQEILFNQGFTDNRFPNELKAQFRELSLKDILRFENILAIGPGDAEHKVPPINFLIQ
jgi:hypothetical protein